MILYASVVVNQLHVMQPSTTYVGLTISEKNS